MWRRKKVSNLGGSLESALQETPSASEVWPEVYPERERFQGLTQGSFAQGTFVLPKSRGLSISTGQKFDLLIAHHHGQAISWATDRYVEAFNNFFTEARPAVDFRSLVLVAASIGEIEEHYIVTEGREEMQELFFYERDLPKLLLEAVRPLRESFGDKLLQLNASTNDDDISLKATILWPGDIASATAALEDFDERWWLDNCSRAHGHLIFDYELADGV